MKGCSGVTAAVALSIPTVPSSTVAASSWLRTRPRHGRGNRAVASCMVDAVSFRVAFLRMPAVCVAQAERSFLVSSGTPCAQTRSNEFFGF